MKKLLMMMMLCTFGFATFAIEMPQQDTTRQKQDTSKKRTDKKSPQKKTTKKKGWPANDTLKRTDRRADTTMRQPQN